MSEIILTADAGSTKTEWMQGGTIVRTQGINPIHQTDEAICHVLTDELCPQIDADSVTEIHFYGSGVRPEQETRIERLLHNVFPAAHTIEAKSDMLGAARALCADREGIACILGTGSNSCLYDGRQIVQSTPSLGYILGDEGSGARLGISFLHELYKGRLYQGAVEEFEDAFRITLPDIFARVYTQPMANRWLASLSAYINGHLGYDSVRQLVLDNMCQFIACNILPFNRPDLPISAVGSIAFYYHDFLAEAAQMHGYSVGTVLQSPLEAFK